MPTIVGLDLGKHTFRAVELEKSRSGLAVTHIGEYENLKLDFNDTSKNSLKEYAAAIRDFIRDQGFKTSKAVVSLEEKDTFMRLVNLPKMSDKELKSSIKFEAEQYIPVPMDEVNLDFQMLDLPGDPKDKMSVQLVAAKKSILKRYVEVIRDAKMTPVGLEPEALAIGRSLSASAKDDTGAQMILHMGFERTLIIITLKGFVVFTRTLSAGGDAMTRAIEQGLGLDYVQAEEYKKAYGLNTDQAEGKVFEVLEPMFENILSEVGRATVFFTTHQPGVNINRVILSGGTALMPGLFFYMASKSSAEVELANPFKDITFAKELESKKDHHTNRGPLYSIAVGLALKELL